MTTVSISSRKSWQNVSLIVLIFLSGASNSFTLEPRATVHRERRRIQSISLSNNNPNHLTATRRIRRRILEDARKGRIVEMAAQDAADEGGTTDSSSDAGEPDGKTAPASAASNEKNSVPSANKNLATKRLLTVPLFIKFVAVLLIKFVTDLVVFPALFLYRLAHNAKRKVMNLFRKDSASLNGDKSSSS